MTVDIQEKTLQQGTQWRVGDVLIGIVRVGSFEGVDAAELLLRSDSESRRAVVTVGGPGETFAGWDVSLLWAHRPTGRTERETVRMRARPVGR